MNEAVHKVQETLESGKNRLHEQAVAGSGDYQKADQLKTQHKAQETGTAAAHRIDETVKRTADRISEKIHPTETTGEKVDRTINKIKH